MEIRVIAKNSESCVRAEHGVELRVRMGLGAFVSEVKSVVITFYDVECIEGGWSTLCSLEVICCDGRRVLSSGIDGEASWAINCAIGRVTTALARPRKVAPSADTPEEPRILAS